MTTRRPLAGVCPKAEPEDGHETRGSPEAKSPGQPKWLPASSSPSLEAPNKDGSRTFSDLSCTGP